MSPCGASGDANNEHLLGKHRLLGDGERTRKQSKLARLKQPHISANLHGLVELVRRGEYVDVGARHAKDGRVVGHPSEVGAEAVGALSSG